MTRVKTIKSARGGSRPGSGRIPIYGEGKPLIRFPARLTDDHIDLIRSIDPKNLNNGLRLILDNVDVRIAIQNMIASK